MKAIVLLSGGLDSSLNLALALEKGRECVAISFNYGQKHRIELDAAAKIAAHYRVPHKILKIDPVVFGKTPLVTGGCIKDRNMSEIEKDILSPNYVPFRNSVFLSLAIAQAEVENADEIYFGGNAADHSFPDCSPHYIHTMQALIDCAIPHRKITIIAPLLYLSKVDIATEARRVTLPIEMTHSCYDPLNGAACGRCDACIIRAQVTLNQL